MDVKASRALQLHRQLLDSRHQVIDVVVDATGPPVLKCESLGLLVPNGFVNSLRIERRVNVNEAMDSFGIVSRTARQSPQ